MKKARFINIAAVAAMTLGTFAVSAPAQARNYYDRGDYYNQSYDGYRGDYRGNYGRNYDRGYYADRGSYYRGDDRGYRGRGYRCRNDGTTGTIVGAVAGGLLGNSVVGRRGDKTAGTIIGGAVGALAGRAIEKGDNRC